MAMGRKRGLQQALWIATEELARTGGHAFYGRVNQILEKHQFDTFVEDLKAILALLRLLLAD